jgi:hypothetical protein
MARRACGTSRGSSRLRCQSHSRCRRRSRGSNSRGSTCAAAWRRHCAAGTPRQTCPRAPRRCSATRAGPRRSSSPRRLSSPRRSSSPHLVSSSRALPHRAHGRPFPPWHALLQEHRARARARSLAHSLAQARTQPRAKAPPPCVSTLAIANASAATPRLAGWLARRPTPCRPRAVLGGSGSARRSRRPRLSPRSAAPRSFVARSSTLQRASSSTAARDPARAAGAASVAAWRRAPGAGPLAACCAAAPARGARGSHGGHSGQGARSSCCSTCGRALGRAFPSLRPPLPRRCCALALLAQGPKAPPHKGPRPPPPKGQRRLSQIL